MSINELELEVRRNQLIEEYNSPEASARRRVQFRERHRQLSRLSANFESDADRDARLAAEVESELHISRTGSGSGSVSGSRFGNRNSSVANGIPIAKVSWTEQWADDQPHVTIPDSARHCFDNLKLGSEPSPMLQPPIAVGVAVR